MSYQDAIAACERNLVTEGRTDRDMPPTSIDNLSQAIRQLALALEHDMVDLKERIAKGDAVPASSRPKTEREALPSAR